MTKAFTKVCGIIAISSLFHQVSFGQKKVLSSLTLRAPIEKAIIKEVALNKIAAYNIVRSGSVDYVAGETIVLEHGFQVIGNGHFSARIEPADVFVPAPDIAMANEGFEGAELAIKTYPNPFLDDTQIEYWLPETSSVNLAVYDNEGHRVGLLVENQVQTKGKHKVTFESKHLPSGIYSCVIVTPDAKKVNRVLKR
jgi:hypothetical protein